MGYKEKFSAKGEFINKSPAFFLVRVEPESQLYGNALALAQNVIPSMDNVFTSRCGSQLGLEALEDKITGNAVVLWRNGKSIQVILMTNGKEIITSDPCFLPIDNQELGIGILDNQKNIQTWYEEHPWIPKLVKRLPQMGIGEYNMSTTIETMKTALERKVNFASVKGRRAYF